MTKDEIQTLSRNYNKLKTALRNNQTEIQVTGYRRTEKIQIDEDVKTFIKLLTKLKQSLRDREVLKIFEYGYEKNLKDRMIINRVHMADSTFYRIKNKLRTQILLLCAANNLISEEEIFNIQIC